MRILMAAANLIGMFSFSNYIRENAAKAKSRLNNNLELDYGRNT